MKPKIYKQIKAFLFNDNIEFIKDFRLINGGLL